MRKFSILSLALAAVGAHAGVITQWDFNQYTDTASQSVLLTAAPSVGAGTATVVTSTDAKSVLTDGAGTLSSDPNQSLTNSAFWSVGNFQAQGVGSDTTGVVYAASTVGFTGITFTWDQRWTKHSSEFGQLEFTTDGTTWLKASSANGVTGTYADGLIDGSYLNSINGSFAGATEGFTDKISYNFAGVAGASNNAKFAVREFAVFAPGTQNYTQSVDATSGGYGGTSSGRWKFDMVTFSGQAVPEPMSILALGVGAVALIKKRRK